ncbi:uncharacterized protein LOC122265441 [Penaeus japonicus]|uniref:uncharacterized protein LOC122265441 n=1 Tax=Penaeus japonicus TaxID=27405 RepID=UPI001C70CF21|nr:uncharacterized protein LOC122265441 [Penaeus japonicus]
MGRRGVLVGRPSSLSLGLVLLVAAMLSLATPGAHAKATRSAREVGSRVPLRFAGGRNAFQPSVGALSSNPLSHPIVTNRNSPVPAAPPVVFGPKIRPRPWRFWF